MRVWAFGEGGYALHYLMSQFVVFLRPASCGGVDMGPTRSIHGANHSVKKCQ